LIEIEFSHFRNLIWHYSFLLCENIFLQHLLPKFEIESNIKIFEVKLFSS
jgi:hypothetical protein